MFGDPAVTGKPSGDDLRSGKRTVLLAEAVDLADKSDPRRPLLRTAVGNDLSDDCTRVVRGDRRSVGALAAVRNASRPLTHRALSLLEGKPDQPSGENGLAELARLAANRSA